MRLKPVAPLNGMETNEATQIADIDIPRGTPVLALTRHCAVNEQYFSNAKEFNPDRWSVDAAEQTHHPRRFPAFRDWPTVLSWTEFSIRGNKNVFGYVVQTFRVRWRRFDGTRSGAFSIHNVSSKFND